MSSEQPLDVKFEIGHVLFIDIVGYSKLLINEQSAQIETLRKIVRGTEQFRLAEAAGKLARLPTGDGGALVFRNSPEAPVLCALEISKTLQSHPELRVRMGIHSGPVNEVTDLNEQANIAGAGINIAQRVMDCGDAGHILLSKHVADDLEHYPRWQPLLHPLGECEVKHGVRIGVINLHNHEVGNAKAPRKLQAVQQHRRRTRWAAIVTALLLFSVIVAAFVIVSKRSKPTAKVPEKSIAVLPFENLSEDKSNAYFADGIQDEILTKLASIADLKVISRTSTAKYKSKPEDLKTVSQQLGVATVVEGTVQRAANKVRVNVQLIDARADSHLWAKSYDRDIKDVFAVESEVSQEIAEALQAKLSPNEANTLAAAPTRDAEAYDLFLKGEYQEREAESSLKGESFDSAAAFYQKALDRDPKFALAAARLAESRATRHWFVTKLSETELDRVKSMAEHALVLAPNLAEAHIALGTFYYLGHRQYDSALEEYQRALNLQPNNLKALEFSAYVHRRQGDWQQALTELNNCKERDPLDAALLGNIAGAYCNLRLWTDARSLGLRCLALDPRNVVGMRAVVSSDLNGAGDIRAAKRSLASFPPDVRLINKVVIANAPGVIGEATYLHVMEHEFGAALKDWDNETTDPDENRMRMAARAAIHVLAGSAGGAREEIEKTRSLLEARLQERPQDGSTMIQLAWVNLALANKTEALHLAQKASELLPVAKDALGGPLFLTGLAEIQARVGETKEAVENLHQLLSIPAGFVVSIQRLKIDPVWDPIRNDPRFQQLLTGEEQIGPNQ
ncbi:MAG TPA: adenylate/guanylate cyclase domain-containing protein [Chthoniobacterales bacterium]